MTLRSYRDPIHAELARVRLEGAGIAAELADQHLVGIQWLYSRAIGGVKLRVREADLERAREALLEDRSGDLPQAADEACPACGATALRRSRVQRNAAALSLLTSLPLIAWRRRWVCAACGHAWREEAARGAPPAEALEAEERVHETRHFPLLRALLAVLVGLAILHYVQIQLRSAS